MRQNWQTARNNNNDEVKIGTHSAALGWTAASTAKGAGGGRNDVAADADAVADEGGPPPTARPAAACT